MVPTRNNKGAAHENGSVESAHDPFRGAIRDALLMRGSSDFADLGNCRAVIDDDRRARECRPRQGDRGRTAPLQDLPARRSTDFEEVIVSVSGPGGSTLRKVFHTVPSRLVGHRLRVRLSDDRLEVLIGATHLPTLPRGTRGGHWQAWPGGERPPLSSIRGAGSRGTWRTLACRLGRTLDSFAAEAVPMSAKARAMAMAAGDSRLAKGAAGRMSGPPGGGRRHLAAHPALR